MITTQIAGKISMNTTFDHTYSIGDKVFFIGEYGPKCCTIADISFSLFADGRKHVSYRGKGVSHSLEEDELFSSFEEMTEELKKNME